ncbi:MAG: 4-alpha-glucanotransferase [Desulfuromonadia bacterium]
MNRRRAGILLHPTSLPSNQGIGALGGQAFRFIDRLRESGFTLWQTLPLGPAGYGNSPYSCFSAFAGNPLLIDLEALAAEGDLNRDELPVIPAGGRIDFGHIVPLRMELLRRAACRFLDAEVDDRKREFWHFCDSTFWLHDHALFMALHRHFEGRPWNRWPAEIRDRRGDAVARWSEQVGREIGIEKYLQWQFRRQWERVRRHAARQGVLIIGDTPIYVASDSSDVWCNRHLFMLDEKGRPTHVAGVPPDYFSRNGQLWGNPLYRWETHVEDRFGWWLARVMNDLDLFDIIRLDHFRGFAACWGVPATHRTARNGSWIPAPGDILFERIRGEIGSLPFIAEDLGIITPDVEALRDRLGLMGMKILQFAFDGGWDNPYLPHNHTPNAVVYTGTHDNDTLVGWERSLPPDTRRRVTGYFGSDGTPLDHLSRAVLSSVCRFAILPLQDLLRLGPEARMNIPGRASGNWGWQSAEGDLEAPVWDELRSQLLMYDRIPSS